MLYFETTLLILLWFLCFSLAWAASCYGLGARHLQRILALVNTLSIVPALVLGLLAIVGTHYCFGINLLFPIEFDFKPHIYLVSAVPPAFILFCASGMWFYLTRAIWEQKNFWGRKTFVTVTKSLGCSPDRALFLVVLGSALGQSLSQALPWLFSELIVVEAVFNAPGLGLDAWHKAQSRDMSGLFVDGLELMGLYAVCFLGQRYWTKQLGKRLASYS